MLDRQKHLISSISSIVGIDGAAPGLVTAIAAAFADSSSASPGVLPDRIPLRKNPEKVSPAAVVSTAFTRTAS